MPFFSVLAEGGHTSVAASSFDLGRGGEEINDTTRHDYVSLELNTLRVGKKMEIRVVYKHTPFPQIGRAHV